MSKRFTDSEKWKKPWFRKLSPLHKCFWQYLIDNCNLAGIWDVDFDLASIFIGETINPSEIELVFQKQFTPICGGKKWFLNDFIQFQYSELQESNRFHVSILKILEKEGVSKALIRALDGDKDKNKDKVKTKGGVGENKKPDLNDLKEAFKTGGLETALAEVEAYKFLAYYESVGWVVGRARKPMKSWRGAVSTWLRNRAPDPTGAEKPVKKIRKRSPTCTACDKDGYLPDGEKCWCWC